MRLGCPSVGASFVRVPPRLPASPWMGRCAATGGSNLERPRPLAPDGSGSAGAGGTVTPPREPPALRAPHTVFPTSRHAARVVTRARAPCSMPEAARSGGARKKNATSQAGSRATGCGSDTCWGEPTSCPLAFAGQGCCTGGYAASGCCWPWAGKPGVNPTTREFIPVAIERAPPVHICATVAQEKPHHASNCALNGTPETLRWLNR
jgi:hypothetical protein